MSVPLSCGRPGCCCFCRSPSPVWFVPKHASYRAYLPVSYMTGHPTAVSAGTPCRVLECTKTNHCMVVAMHLQYAMYLVWSAGRRAVSLQDPEYSRPYTSWARVGTRPLAGAWSYIITAAFMKLPRSSEPQRAMMHGQPAAACTTHLSLTTRRQIARHDAMHVVGHMLRVRHP